MFDFENVKDDEFELLEIGNYPASVESAEWTTSQKGNEYLNVKFKLTNGRFLWDIFCLTHEKDTVKNIAMRKMKELLTAGGNKNLKTLDKSSIIEAVEVCKVKLAVSIKKDDNFGSKNIIKKYFPLSQEEIDSSIIPF